MSASASQTGRRLPWGLLGTLALIVAVEGFIDAHKLRFSRVEPDDWAESARVATSGMPAGGVVILGDSQVKFGLSPLQIEAAIGQPVQCLAVQGGQAPASYFLLRRAIRSGMIPSAIVVDFEPHLLRQPPAQARMWAELATLPECFELARAMRSPTDFAAMAVARLVPSVRDRLEVRGNLMAALRGTILRDGGMIDMSRRNRGMNRGALLMPRDLGDHGADLSRWANASKEPWAPDPANDAFARRLLRLALDHKIPVVLPIMPTAPGVQAKFEANAIDSGYLTWVRKLQSRYSNLVVLDGRYAGYESAAFLDALHLNTLGASTASLAVGETLQRVVRGPIGGDRWVTMPPYRSPSAVIAVEDAIQSDAVMRGTASLRR